MFSDAHKHAYRGCTSAHTCGGVRSEAMPPVNSIKPLRTRTRSPSCGQALVRPSLASSLQGPRQWNLRVWRRLARAP